MMRVDILTLFPEMFGGVLSCSIIKRAREKGLLDVVLTDIRDFAMDKHRSVDDRPYGGGAGMVLKAGPVVRAVRKVREEGPGGDLILTTPQGEVFDQGTAKELAARERIVIICGHYEGYDERVREILRPREVSIGDYILTGGEIAAMTILDAVARLVPGVLGREESAEEESFSDGLLEYPQYTRPAAFEGREAPEVLLSGDHARVAEWRKEAALERTRRRRPDLLARRKGVKL